MGRGGRDGQRQRGAGIGRAPRPGLRSGVQAGGLCAHQSQPRKIQDPEPRPRGGLAPAALSDLPAPDAVFIGGSKGSLAAIVDAALDKNPDARICVSAIALESLSAAVAALTAKGRTVQVSQIAVSRARAVGGLHLMMAQNPIYLITGE